MFAITAIVADDTGLVKQVHSTDKGVVLGPVLRKQDRAAVVQAMCFGDTEDEILLGCKSGIVECYDLATSKRTIEVESSAAAKSASAYVGLHCHDRLITYANENGTVTCVSRDDAGNTTEITAAPQANVMKVCEEKPNLFAIGGTDSEVRIWDINDAAKPVFKAKNVKPDKLFLQALKCVKSIDFMPGSDGSQIVTGTAYKELRLYDSKAKLRPMFNEVVSDYAINSVSVAPDGTHVVVGDVFGTVFSIDLRTRKRIGNYRGVTGAVRTVVCHKTLPLVACCGLDRHLRVYNIKSRKCLFKTYMKQRLNCLLLTSTDETPEADDTAGAVAGAGGEGDEDGEDSEGDEDEEDADDDDVWGELEVEKETSKSKKRKTGGSGSSNKKVRA